MTNQEKPLSFLSTFDPRPLQYRSDPQYPSFFHNACINCRGCVDMPILQNFIPTIYAINNDHDYFELSPEDFFLQSIHVTSVTDEIIEIN